jgi:hypothetical protein
VNAIAMKKTVWMAISAIVFLAGSQVAAQRNGFMIQSTRSVGMGGTGVALVGPDNAVFFNPALLAEIDRTFIRLMEVQAMVNGNTFKHLGSTTCRPPNVPSFTVTCSTPLATKPYSVSKEWRRYRSFDQGSLPASSSVPR